MLSFSSGLGDWQAVRGKGVNVLGSQVSQSMRKISSLPSAWKRSNSDQSVLLSTVYQAVSGMGSPSSFFSASAASVHREHLQGPHQPLAFSPIRLSRCSPQTLGLPSLLENSRLHPWLSSTPATAIFILLCHPSRKQDHEQRSYSPAGTCNYSPPPN